MRITQGMMTQQFVYNITNQAQQMQTLENELSTGKSLNEPSDNPLAVSQDMSIRSSLSETTGYQSTIQSGLSWMQNTSSALQQIQTALTGIQSTVLEGINGTSQNPMTLQALSKTAQQLSNSVYQELNAKQGDSYLFGGMQQNVAPASATSISYPSISTTEGAFYSIPNSFTTTNSSSITANGAQIAQTVTDPSGILSSTQPYELQMTENFSAGTATSGTVTLLNQFTGAVMASGTMASAVSGSIVTLTAVSGTAQLTMTLGAPVTVLTGGSGSVTLTQSMAPTADFTPSFKTNAGATGTFSYNVAPSVTMTINVSASALMLSGPTGSTLEDTLKNVSSDLLTGNTAGLQSDLTNLQTNMTNITNIAAGVGSGVQSLTALQNQLSSYQTTLTNQKGVIEGANMAQVISQFNTDQTVYTAALQMGSQILLPSLVSFLPNG